ncbi:hypothetical protein [Amycolatopsis sp. H20-H5]|uniref:hypothetical protein n=1 Tax=Amycolatopsis sp. H20-H5 TaxID=3046309 RepID=UPI002DBF86BB|nr:hypothetical protein [Amycolatopsis sp. H20-H5]MEC3981822.1 hypothetical protein [Amycolatopsis sp. H20-H5]
MLQAKRTSLLAKEYELTRDDRALTTFSVKRGRIGAQFTLDGADYRIRSHRFSGVYELLGADGSVLATTDRVSRRWSMHVSGRAWHFRRTAIASRDYSMIGEQGERTGSIRRTGHGSSGVAADLPGLELNLQVFALAVVLLRWRRKRAAVAVRGAALAGG